MKKKYGPEPKYKNFTMEDVTRLASQGLTNTQIADCLNIGHSTYYLYYKENKDFKDAVDKGRSKGIGFATSKLFELIKEKNLGAIIYYLRCRDTERWNEKKQIDIKSENTHTIEAEKKVKDVYLMTDEELAEIALKN